MSQSPEPPPEFHPRWKHQTGVAVLTSGLPDLPSPLDHRMAIPVASWATASCAVVLFLQFSRQDSGMWPKAMMITYGREGGRWSAHRYQGGVGWSHDPIADPHDVRDLGGQAIVQSGGSFTDSPAPAHPAAVVAGRVAAGVTHLAFSQNRREERRSLRSHFGAWVVCAERWSPYEIKALADDGAVLGTLDGPPRLPPRPTSTPDQQSG